MKKTGGENMDVAVPETRRHNEAFTINYRCVSRDFDRAAWSNVKDLTVVYKDRAVFDCRFSRRRINLRANQGQIGAPARADRNEYNTQQQS